MSPDTNPEDSYVGALAAELARIASSDEDLSAALNVVDVGHLSPTLARAAQAPQDGRPDT